MKQILKPQKKNQIGITLIALVITIIVLIILAMVTIAMLTGPNGLLNKSVEARIENDKGEIEDSTETEVLGSYNTKGKIDWDLLEKNLANNVGAKNIKPIDGKNKENGILFEVERNGRKYTVRIDKNGKVTIEYEGKGTEGGSQTLKPGDQATSTEKDNYEDESGKKATIPQGFTVSTEDHEIDTGLVVTAKDGSEFVWVPVPQTTDVYKRVGLGVTDFESNYEKIYDDLKAYSSTYGTPDDSYYVGCGLTPEKYMEYKNKMLKSIYENGGFWIGRYEAGTEKPRTSLDKDNIEEIALSKPNKYPYNNVTCNDAQQLASKMSTNSDLTSSLMFGVQWNLVCMFIEQNATELGENPEARQLKIKDDSKDWGNYQDASFTINSGEYTTNPSIAESWKKFDNGDTTNVDNKVKQINKSVLLTTGASKRNRVLNIYDFAGNEYEWTLDARTDGLCSRRGGSYGNVGKGNSSFVHKGSNANEAFDTVSFRVTLY